MEPARLTFACGRYDRMEALREGSVRPERVDLDYVAIDSPREIFDRAVGKGEFDMLEFSMSEFVRAKARGENDMVAIPVFPSRLFRHGFIFINNRSGIGRPEDLAGKRIGMGLYTQTASVWIRGHLASQYGVDLSTVTWVQGAIEKPGSHGTPKSRSEIPNSVHIEDNTTDKSLSQLLADGEIDALIGARIPDGYGTHPNVVRLFTDYREVERKFFESTGVFPVMHLVAIRRQVYEAHPHIASAMYAALEQSKTIALQRMRFSAASKYMFPWQFADIEEMDRVFDGDPFRYGIEANRRTLETFVGHLAEQGLIDAPMPIESLFVPGVGDGVL